MLGATVKGDRQVWQEVLRELRWDSSVDETEVGVEVKQGIVRLTGPVNSDSKKLAARDAARRVVGVLDVADDLQVKCPGGRNRMDIDIARIIRTTVAWDALVPDQKVRSAVSNGFVILEGEVATLREREDVEAAVRNLAGVKGVSNRLLIAAGKADPAKACESIEEDGTVVPEGTVGIWPAKQAIPAAVSHAPGV